MNFIKANRGTTVETRLKKSWILRPV
jgi:hypothetical protein